MCGLFCIVSKKESGFSDKELTIFSQGLFADTVRGKDSTGVFSVSDSGNVYTLKDNIPGDKFTRTKEFEDFISKSFMSSRILVGHNRSATLGNVSAKNAHPFISGDTVLVHNGTLFTHKELANTETDSEAITQALEAGDYTKVLPELNGAFALIWYNAGEKKFYVTRNSERPLWIIQTKDFDLIGSEPKLLEWILHRNLNIEKDACYFKPYSIYIWSLDNLKSSYTKTVDFEKKKQTYTFPGSYQQKTYIPTSNTTDKLFYNLISICPYNFEIVANKITIRGVNPDHPTLIFQTTIYNRTEVEIKELEEKETILVRPFNKTKEGIYVCSLETSTFSLTDIGGKKHYLPQNNNCSRCQKYITKKDDGLIWVRVKKDHIKTILCPECVRKNQHLIV